MDGATNAIPGETVAPKPGDLTVCCYCGNPAQYTDAGFEKVIDLSVLNPIERYELKRAMLAVSRLPAHLRTPPPGRSNKVH